MQFGHPDELLDHVGNEIGVSDWVEIDQAMINAFADATGDHQWIHVDPERAAKEVPGGKTIAHGYLLLSLFPRLTDAFFTVAQNSYTLNYGLERLRFTSMVPVGSRVRLRQSVASAEKTKDDGVRVVLDGVVEIEGNERPAVVAQTIRLIYP
ncbi:MAG: MaoC family dehydratase [Alphaproteobacteria bacterium]|nr:MaoC family dehydratase [Alphaproteobacteria bacterium]